MPVVATWNHTPPNYNVGDTIVGTISGTLTVQVGQSVATLGPFDIPVVTDSGTGTASFPAVQVTVPGGTREEEAFIDAPAGSTLALGGKTFTVSADRKSITAAA
jgi:hypothetical protein